MKADNLGFLGVIVAGVLVTDFSPDKKEGSCHSLGITHKNMIVENITIKKLSTQGEL